MKRSYTYALAVFFTIKIKLEDWNGSICAPTYALWKKWRILVQNPRFYQELCRTFAEGEMIDLYYNAEDCERSYLTTYLLAVKYYSELDTSIWKYPVILKLPRSIISFKKFHSSDSEMCIRYKKGQTMADLKVKLRKRLNLDSTCPILLFHNGETFINENEQAEKYDPTTNDCVVHWFTNQ